ncbi:hypothetical protein [Solibacillus cecembensis]|uniref:hypothetical protein n=1 Tax=Solibacillus cecembensis TaxID=459347 RepID=UPI003D032179
MNKLMIGIVIIVICFPFLIAAASVFHKKTSEFEQLVLGELSQYLSSEEVVVPTQEFQIEKPSLISSYDEWIIYHETAGKRYQYVAGEIVEIAGD